MSFVNDFKTIITGDASINAMVTGGIKYNHLPEDFDIKKVWLSWDFSLIEQNNVLNFNAAYSKYSISITMTASDTIVLQNLSDRVTTYLNGISNRMFPDIWALSDNGQTTLNKPTNVYQNSLELNCIYVG